MKALDIVINEVNFNIQMVEHEGTKWIPVTPICEVLGIKAHKQQERIKADSRFNHTQLGGVGAGGT